MNFIFSLYRSVNCLWDLEKGLAFVLLCSLSKRALSLMSGPEAGWPRTREFVLSFAPLPVSGHPTLFPLACLLEMIIFFFYFCLHLLFWHYFLVTGKLVEMEPRSSVTRPLFARWLCWSHSLPTGCFLRHNPTSIFRT